MKHTTKTKAPWDSKRSDKERKLSAQSAEQLEDILRQLEVEEQRARAERDALAAEKQGMLPDYPNNRDRLREINSHISTLQLELEDLGAAKDITIEQQRDEDAWKKWQEHRAKVIEIQALLQNEACRVFVREVVRTHTTGDDWERYSNLRAVYPGRT